MNAAQEALITGAESHPSRDLKWFLISLLHRSAPLDAATQSISRPPGSLSGLQHQEDQEESCWSS